MVNGGGEGGGGAGYLVAHYLPNMKVLAFYELKQT